MFEDVFRQLQRLEAGVSIPISLELDDAGFLDRRCPHPLCHADFKVLFEDWRDHVRDEVVYCPLCRHQDASSEWNTPPQQKQIEAEALRYVHGQVSQAFGSAARSFNRSQPRDGIISLSMSYRPDAPPIVMPASASDLLRQTFACELCGCRYSSLGAAFFCPTCGHNNAASTFLTTIETVRKTLSALPEIRASVSAAADEDTAENSVRQIRENGLVRLVSAFQRFAAALFDRVPDSARFSPRPNVFQNLKESDKLWRDAVGTGYTDLLSESDYALLETYFQQRHLLAHRDGLVDKQYVERCGDSRYSEGQRLVVTTQSIVELAGLLDTLAGGMQRWVSSDQA